MKESSPKKLVIFIVGAPFTTNYGVMALVISAIKALRKFLPTSTRYVIGSIYQDFDSKRYGSIFHEHDVKIIGIKHMKILPIQLRVPLLLLKSIPYYLSADLILEMPGEISTTVSLISQCFRLITGMLVRKPVVIYAASLGPFRSGFARLLAKIVYNKINMITVREKLTRDYLLRIGVDRSLIFLTADHAFLLKPTSKERTNKILMNNGISERDRPLIGFSPKQDYVSKKRGYGKSVIRVIDYLIKKMDATVVLIPHTVEDAPVAKEMLRMLKQKHKLKLIAGGHFPDELKGVIGQCDMFIGSRMHSCIASVSMHVPTIAIIPTFEHKALGIMQMLNQAEFVVDPSASFYELVSKIESCWSNRQRIKKELERKIKGVQELALLNAKLINKLMSKTRR